MTDRPHPRLPWRELPAPLRPGVEQVLGGRVVAARSVASGQSPGSADVVTTADGRTAFAKAADASVNAVTVQLHRREHLLLSSVLDGTGPAPPR